MHVRRIDRLLAAVDSESNLDRSNPDAIDELCNVAESRRRGKPKEYRAVVLYRNGVWTRRCQLRVVARSRSGAEEAALNRFEATHGMTMGSTIEVERFVL